MAANAGWVVSRGGDDVEISPAWPAVAPLGGALECSFWDGRSADVRQLFAIKDAGELPFIEVGAQTFLFDPQDLAEWLRKKKKTKGA